MGCIQSKGKHPCEEEVKVLREKVRVLEEEVNEIMCLRESESEAYEREMVVYEFKEAGWKQERRRMREEAKKLRKELEEKEERIIRMLEDDDDDEKTLVGEKSSATEKEYWDWPLLVEQVMNERARRDEAVEKWKRLYLAIKIELDDLIQRTHQGGRLDWKAEEGDPLVEELQRELKEKEDTIALQARVASMEKEESKRGREVDILRQSLRIMSHDKKPTPNHHQNCQKPLQKVSFVKQQRWMI